MIKRFYTELKRHGVVFDAMPYNWCAHTPFLTHTFPSVNTAQLCDSFFSATLGCHLARVAEDQLVHATRTVVPSSNHHTS